MLIINEIKFILEFIILYVESFFNFTLLFNTENVVKNICKIIKIYNSKKIKT